MTIAIVGFGLMGGSFGYALKGFRDCVRIAVDPDRTVRAAARESGAADEATASFPKAVAAADWVLLCTPPDVAARLLAHFPPHKPETVVSDICGLKLPLRVAPETDWCSFHPMVGRERGGFAAADGTMFRDSRWILCPTDETSHAAVDLLLDVMAFLGVRTWTTLSPAEHDRAVTATSHLPHLLANALAMTTTIDNGQSSTVNCSGGSFADMTRVAGANPALWAELFYQNRKNNRAALAQVRAALDTLERNLDHPAAMADLLRHIAEIKESW